MRLKSILCYLCALLLAGIAAAQSGSPSQPNSPGDSKNSSDKAKEPQFAWPELVVLDAFAGPWEVSELHYNPRGDVVGSAKGIEEATWVLDRRTLRRTYTTGQEPTLYRAIGMITWDATEKTYEGSWFDNSTASGPTSFTGTWDAPSRTMTITLRSNSADGKPVQHKVIDAFVDDEHRLVTTYKVNGTQVEKLIEVKYSRARPCPSNLGIIPEPGGKP